MAALAYVLLPVSGLIAYFNGSNARIRWHGLQAITIGVLWPAALYAASSFSVRAVQLVWALGAATWLAVMLAAAFGKDVCLPLLGKFLQKAAVESPRAVR
jgi:uncharacterized membrane protein